MDLRAVNCRCKCDRERRRASHQHFELHFAVDFHSMVSDNCRVNNASTGDYIVVWCGKSLMWAQSMYCIFPLYSESTEAAVLAVHRENACLLLFKMVQPKTNASVLLNICNCLHVVTDQMPLIAEQILSTAGCIEILASLTVVPDTPGSLFA